MFNHISNYISVRKNLNMTFQDAEKSLSTIDIVAAPLSVCLAGELSEGCEREDEESSTALTHVLFRFELIISGVVNVAFTSTLLPLQLVL